MYSILRVSRRQTYKSLSRLSSCHTPTLKRTYASETFDPSSVERPQDEVDVLIVGAGPSGLSAAIRLKQLEREKGNEIRVVVLEKASEVGAHILSGAVIEPRSLDELLPEWRTREDRPIKQEVTSSSMLYLTKMGGQLPLPHPPQMGNQGNYIVSLSQVTRWLGQIAEEEYGVEIYPGFGGSSLIFSESEETKDVLGRPRRRVLGVRTPDIGVSRSYTPKSGFEGGMEFHAKVTLLAEGAHGSLSKHLIPYYGLREGSGKEEQTYGMGIKEVWQFDDVEKATEQGRYQAGKVVHTMGWPLSYDTYGGGWVYHGEGGLLSIGLVIGCDWKNPHLSPYREFQKMKHHPYFRNLLLGSPTATGTDSSTHKNPAKRLAYGGRTLTEGGLNSLPSPLHFPGGALIGCAAGFMNVPKIKGTHGAMKSGILAAESAFDALESETPSLESYTKSFEESWLYNELYEVRNVRRSFTSPLGMYGGVIWSGLDTLLLKGRYGSGKIADLLFGGGPGAGTHQERKGKSVDASHTARVGKEGTGVIEYPAFEAPLSTDLMTSIALTGTNHEEDSVVHLKVTGALDPESLPSISTPPSPSTSNPEAYVYSPLSREPAPVRTEHVKTNVEEYAGLLGRACPAGVYEYVSAEEGAEKEKGTWQGKKLVINSQNCIHCKLCDIKVPTQDITWSVPEGGGGPKYSLT